jgi:secreted PhoX family phosphatase
VGEGLARWASNGTIGSEFTGLYFDFRNPNRAYVNIQHPASGVARLIEISAAPHLEQGNKQTRPSPEPPAENGASGCGIWFFEIRAPRDIIRHR